MYEKLLRYAVAKPKNILLITALLVCISIYCSLGVGIKTSNLDLIDNNQEEIKRFLSFSESFGTPNTLLVVFEGQDEKALKKAVELTTIKIRQIPGVRKVLDRVPSSIDQLVSNSKESFFHTEDGKAYFIYVQPSNLRIDINEISPLVMNIRAQVDDAIKDLSVKVGYTGIPQYALDDQILIKRDMSYISLISLLFVVIIFILGFHSFKAPLFATFSLLSAVAVSLAFVRFYPGYLTLLSSPFIMLIFGLGIDYGIHIVSLTEDYVQREGLKLNHALIRSCIELKRTLYTSAFTTAGVFFILYFSDFKGFKELGIVAGVSILLCLFSMICVLPALMSLSPPRLNTTKAYSVDLPLNKFALKLVSILGPILILLSILFSFLPPPSFDTDYLNLQPKGSETVRLERMIVQNSKFSPYFVAFQVSSMQESRDLVRKLKKEDVVGEIRSADDIMSLFNGNPPLEFSGIFEDGTGHFSVIAFPARNIWDPDFEHDFLGRMKALDKEATGLPFIGKLMIEKTKTALYRTEYLAIVLILAIALIDFRNIILCLLVAIPPIFSIISIKAYMIFTGMLFNPLNIMAIPIVLGTAIDNSVHLVHRFKAERGDLDHTLRGAGKSIILTWLTTLAGFGGLVLTSHEGLRSFGILLSLGITFGLMYSLLAVPWCLIVYRKFQSNNF